ncbi:response regulator [Oceanimonas sp. NS1]|nr:response regulator [Oceanimonas sp. NS1]
MPADTHTRILVVDDNEVSAGILENTLSALGYRVDCAANGEEALAEVRQHRFDLILMDWRLPDLSGLEVAKRIQERHGPVTIIMLTAYGHEELAETQNQPNPPFVDLLTKPVTTLQLSESIERAPAGERFEPEKTLPLADEERRLEGFRLLLVEDNAFNRQVACELLAGEGAVVTQAEDGQEGIDKVFNDTGAFDVVLMDMQMPGIDGLEATRRIRRHADCHNLPILAMTANVTVSDQQACLEAGMNAHVGKPIDLDELVRVILTLNQEQAARPESPAVRAAR